jgi:energy-coupling factor transporter transmembrane protein EcfT
MKLVALILAIAVAVGYLLGGRLSQLSELHVRYAPIALIGLLLQVVNPPGRWPFALLIVSFVLLVVFTVANLRTAGFALILVGVVLNLAVIALNGGMPVDRDALLASDQADTLIPLVREQGAKHHLARSDDRLLFLGDVIPVPAPLRQAISIGDLFTYGGVAFVVVATMRRRVRPVPLTSVAEASGVQI